MKSDESTSPVLGSIHAKASSLISSLSKRRIFQPVVQASKELQLISLTGKYRACPELINRGRQKEIQDIFSILQKRRQHNIILVGTFGVGKNSIIEGVAERIAKSQCPKDFESADIVELSILDLNPSLYTMKEIDMKLAALAEHLQKKPNHILYIRNFNLVIEYELFEQIKLFAENFRFISTVDTAKCDMNFLETNEFMIRHFEILSIVPPEYEDIYDMLEYKINQLSKYHGVEITREDVELIMDIVFRNEYELYPWSVLNAIDYAMGVCKSHGLTKVDPRAIFDQNKYYISDFFKMPPEKIKLIAYHEAGHCIVGLALGLKFHGIQIIPSSDSLGSNYFDPGIGGVTYRSEAINKICVSLAGLLATDMKGFERIDGVSSDLVKASSIARNMVVNYGMEDDDLISYVESGQITISYMSEKAKEDLDARVRGILKEATKKTKQILEENSDKLELLVQALLKKGFLTTAEVHDLLADVPDGKKVTIDSLPDIHQMLF